jgi:hypothetical protein
MATVDPHSSQNAQSFLVAAPELAAPHRRALEAVPGLQIIEPGALRERLKPGDFCLFLNEHYPEYRAAIRHAQDLKCPTLLLIDGIIEWRSCWENHYPPKVWKPILCDKAACIGHSQARVLSSWGNEDKVEVVGLPRLDALSARAPRERPADEAFRLLVMTAKNPGFTARQQDTTEHSLRALKAWLDDRVKSEEVRLEATWRLTQDMAQRIGVHNELQDTTGADLAAALEQVDAVITTPSTAMLEAMLQGVPTALLDFHNTPQLAPAAWTISAPEHFHTVIPELIKPPTEKILFQKFLLQQHLQTRTSATTLLMQLIQKMDATAKACACANQPLSFPANLLGAATETADGVLTELQWREVARDQRFLLGRQARCIDVLEDELQMTRNRLRDCERRLSAFLNFPVLKTLLDLRGNWLARRKAKP